MYTPFEASKHLATLRSRARVDIDGERDENGVLNTSFYTSKISLVVTPADPACAWALHRIQFLEQQLKECRTLLQVLNFPGGLPPQGSPKLENTPPLPAAGPTA